MTLVEWMNERGYTMSGNANQIVIGQDLTSEDAIKVRRTVNRAYLDSFGLHAIVDWVELAWPDDVAFLKLLVGLIDAGNECNTNWSNALSNTMDKWNLSTLERMQNMN